MPETEDAWVSPDAATCMDTSPHCPHPTRSGSMPATSQVGIIVRNHRRKAAIWELRGTGNTVRQRITRILAAGALLFMYASGMVATTGAFVAAGVSPAFAQRGRGRGGGWGRGRAVAGAEVEVAVSVQQSASGSAQPSSAARLRRVPPSSNGRMPSAIACSAIVHTIPIARPISAMTAFATPVRRRRFPSRVFGTPAQVPGFCLASLRTCELSSPAKAGDPVFQRRP